MLSKNTQISNREELGKCIIEIFHFHVWMNRLDGSPVDGLDDWLGLCGVHSYYDKVLIANVVMVVLMVVMAFPSLVRILGECSSIHSLTTLCFVLFF